MKSKRYLSSAWAAAALLAGFAGVIPGTSSGRVMTSDETAIRRVLTGYQDALNSSSAAAAVSLYADDGVLMPPYNQSVVGKALLGDVYAGGFKLFTLHVQFTVREVVQVAPDWAFARTSSTGTHKAKATGSISPEANQELFIMRKGADGTWKIARYSFSSTNAPPQ